MNQAQREREARRQFLLDNPHFLDGDADVNQELRNLLLSNLRREFIVKVYLITAFWIVLTVLQWGFILLIDEFQQFIRECYFLSFIASVLLLLLIATVTVAKVRRTAPFNWIFATTIVQLTVIALALTIVTIDKKYPLFCLWFAASTFALFSLVGAFIPCDCTRHISYLLLVSAIFLLTSIIFMIILFWKTIYEVSFFFVGMMIFLLILYTIFHAQTIAGNKFIQLPFQEFVLASILNYFDFVFLFLLAIVLVKLLLEQESTKMESA